MPALVTTRSPVFKLETSRCCCCWRFRCGRTITKYMMTMMKNQNGKRLIKLEGPPVPGVGAADCAGARNKNIVGKLGDPELKPERSPCNRVSRPAPVEDAVSVLSFGWEAGSF